MDFVKLDTSYYRDNAIMRVGEAAEVLFARALAYCGEQETCGVISREALPYLTPTRGRARAAALVREGLWELHPEGWKFRSWDKHQVSMEQLQARRASGRDRQARYRSRDASSDGVRNGVTNARVTPREVEVEEEPLLTPVSQSPSATRAIDGLTNDELEQLRRRLGSTEDHAARVALQVLSRADAEVLRPLRYILAAVDAEPDRYRPTPGPPRKSDCCPEPGHGSYPAAHCGACRADELAGDLA